MQIKHVKPINFLFFRIETTVNELHNFLTIGQSLFKEAIRYELTITGPVHWHYFEFYGDPSKPFTLEISLPVSEVPADYDGKFHFKRTEDFKCVSAVHEGSWLEMPRSYEKLMEFIGGQNLHPKGVNREVYVNVDFNTPEANATEIQVGVN